MSLESSAPHDVAVVLSGGGMNGVLMECGFLKRLRESELWPRVGWFFGTSAGALSGTMAALDRLDDLERFLVTLEAHETFRPNRLWRLPFLGLHEYALPRTIAERLGHPRELAEALRVSERELVVFATDLSLAQPDGDVRDYELAYSSRDTPPEELSQAILASAAISALVLPLRVGDRIVTDGGWVRNFPIGAAFERPEVRLIVAFRHIPRYPPFDAGGLVRLRRRLRRFRRVPPIRALIEELEVAEERHARGEPAHLGEMTLRLTRAAVVRNTVLEEQLADDRDSFFEEIRRLRRDFTTLIDECVSDPEERRRLGEALRDRYSASRFFDRYGRAVPRITVRASAGNVNLEPGFLDQRPWTVQDKQELIARGYELTDRELGASAERHGASVGALRI